MGTFIGMGKGCIMFWGRSTENSGFTDNRKLLVELQWADNSFDFIRTPKENINKFTDEFEFRVILHATVII